VQLAYAIGVARPVSVRVDTFGTACVAEADIAREVEKLVDLRPAAIINRFGLRRPIYSPLAAYGHMGREELAVGWEATDLVPALKAALL
jgi:S-adenosylmethionine synthetase